MSLIRRRVSIEPRTLGDLRQILATRGYRSFWGHMNTLACAESLLGVPIRPSQERPALVLDAGGYPCLDGTTFTECWILSPDYRVGYRPAVGEEVGGMNILGWDVLKMVWDK